MEERDSGRTERTEKRERCGKIFEVRRRYRRRGEKGAERIGEIIEKEDIYEEKRN